MDDIAQKYAKDTRQILDMYFILDTYSHRVKIGVTKNIRQRFQMLNQASSTDLKLLGVIRNILPDYESYVHSLWDNHRVKNEWFELVPELREWIEANSEIDSIDTWYVRNPRIAHSARRIRKGA